MCLIEEMRKKLGGCTTPQFWGRAKLFGSASIRSTKIGDARNQSWQNSGSRCEVRKQKTWTWQGPRRNPFQNEANGWEWRRQDKQIGALWVPQPWISAQDGRHGWMDLGERDESVTECLCACFHKSAREGVWRVHVWPGQSGIERNVRRMANSTWWENKKALPCDPKMCPTVRLKHRGKQKFLRRSQQDHATWTPRSNPPECLEICTASEQVERTYDDSRLGGAHPKRSVFPSLPLSPLLVLLLPSSLFRPFFSVPSLFSPPVPFFSPFPLLLLPFSPLPFSPSFGTRPLHPGWSEFRCPSARRVGPLGKRRAEDKGNVVANGWSGAVPSRAWRKTAPSSIGPSELRAEIVDMPVPQILKEIVEVLHSQLLQLQIWRLSAVHWRIPHSAPTLFGSGYMLMFSAYFHEPSYLAVTCSVIEWCHGEYRNWIIVEMTSRIKFPYSAPGLFWQWTLAHASILKAWHRLFWLHQASTFSLLESNASVARQCRFQPPESTSFPSRATWMRRWHPQEIIRWMSCRHRHGHVPRGFWTYDEGNDQVSFIYDKDQCGCSTRRNFFLAPHASVKRKCCSSQVFMPTDSTLFSFLNNMIRDVDIRKNLYAKNFCQVARTCGGVLYGQGSSSSAEVRGLVIHDIKEVEGVKQQEEQEDKRDEEIEDEVNAEVEEVTQRAHETWVWRLGEWRHKLDLEPNSVRASRQSKDNDTNWQQKETTKKKDLQCMKTHALAITTLTSSPSVSGHFTHCWDFRSVLHVVNLNYCRCNHLLNFWPIREFLVEVHTAKKGLLRCCLYKPRRLQQTAVS